MVTKLGARKSWEWEIQWILESLQKPEAVVREELERRPLHKMIVTHWEQYLPRIVDGKQVTPDPAPLLALYQKQRQRDHDKKESLASNRQRELRDERCIEVLKNLVAKIEGIPRESGGTGLPAQGVIPGYEEQTEAHLRELKRACAEEDRPEHPVPPDDPE